MFYMLKNKKYIMLTFHSIIQIVKNKFSFNDSKRKMMALSCRQELLSSLLEQITNQHRRGSYCLICFHSFATANKQKSLIKVRENNFFVTWKCPLKTIKY